MFPVLLFAQKISCDARMATHVGPKLSVIAEYYRKGRSRGSVRDKNTHRAKLILFILILSKRKLYEMKVLHILDDIK